MEQDIEIFINNHKYNVKSDQTIMQAADSIGIYIPRLCYHNQTSSHSACRICIVQIEGMKQYVTSCTYKVQEGLKIHTNTKEIREMRKILLDLILSKGHDNCNICDKNGNCDLQELSKYIGLKDSHFFVKNKEHIDSTNAITKDFSKCILCERCSNMCNNIQNVYAISYAGRGFNTKIVPGFSESLKQSSCVSCGQCINVCPTAALTEKNNIQEVLEKLENKNLIKVVQIAPAVRAAIAEMFGFNPGEKIIEKELVTILKQIGFDYVFDTQFSADLTIMEEGSEFLDRLKKNEKLPLITSCSSGWINYIEKFYPNLLNNLSTSKSPMSMLGTLIKTYFAEKNNFSLDNIFSVAIMPCTAKKDEIKRKELLVNGKQMVDFVLTTRELGWLIKSMGIDITKAKVQEFDSPLGESSGAATIFGVSGGVMEAALRTAYELYTQKELDVLDFMEVRGYQGIKEATINMKDKEIKVAVAHGLKNANILMDRIQKNPSLYHFVEIMACPGGCIAGGGQPFVKNKEITTDIIKLRASLLYSLDSNNKNRKSHENEAIKFLYKDFLEKPLSHMSHKLLHTFYTKKEKEC